MRNQARSHVPRFRWLPGICPVHLDYSGELLDPGMSFNASLFPTILELRTDLVFFSRTANPTGSRASCCKSPTSSSLSPPGSTRPRAMSPARRLPSKPGLTGFLTHDHEIHTLLTPIAGVSFYADLQPILIEARREIGLSALHAFARSLGTGYGYHRRACSRFRNGMGRTGQGAKGVFCFDGGAVLLHFLLASKQASSLHW